MKTYPVMLDVAGRRCVVVGAGQVGLRKAAGLARAGADVRVVDPEGPDSPPPDGVEMVRAAYDPALLTGAVLVFACTADAALNARIADDARAAGALANAADQPADCDFFVPAVAADGDVVVAVGTGGAAPALAAALRDRLAADLPGRVGEFADALAAARKHVRARVADPRRRRRVLEALAGQAGYDAFVAAGPDGLIELAERTD
jgi:precorrin-2 dehydrogenase/sirohydrochlorin ferrochelatase